MAVLSLLLEQVLGLRSRYTAVKPTETKQFISPLVQYKAILDMRLRPLLNAASGLSTSVVSNPCCPLLSHVEYTPLTTLIN